MGLTLAGIGLGGLTFVPITGMVISIYGWRIAYMALGISILLPVSIILLLVIRDSPGVMGLQPDGDVPITQAGEDVTSDVSEILSLELGEAVRSGAFWILTVVVFATSFTSFGIIQHLSALLTDIGYTPAIAASTLGSAIGLSIIGRVVSGALSDRWGAQWVCSVLVGLITLSVVALLWADHKLALITFSLCFGLGLGGYNVLLPLLVGMCFGLKAFSKILGVIIFAATIGSSLGPLIVGMLFDVHGDYRIALLVMISLGLVGMITVTFIHRPTMR
tara:strand:- start:190 stop:1017 length:828 start_codon:yes stop_codon:yes gene_type:complete